MPQGLNLEEKKGLIAALKALRHPKTSFLSNRKASPLRESQSFGAPAPAPG